MKNTPPGYSKISLHRSELRQAPPFHLIRLMGQKPSRREIGQLCSLTFRGTIVVPRARITGIEIKTLGELDEGDIHRLMTRRMPTLMDLRLALRETYRYRPQWQEESTRFFVFTIEPIS